MYCSTCGTEVKTPLNYCKNCGARIEKDELEKQESASSYASMAAGFIGTFGLVGVIFLVISLLKSGITEFSLIVILILYLLTLFGLCSMLLFARSPGRSEKSKKNLQDNFANQHLNSANTAQLESPREPIMSVTETTTRTLDEVFVKRN